MSDQNTRRAIRERIGLWTPAAVLCAIGYMFLPTAHPNDRCVMGGPVHPRLHCTRTVIPGSLWCRKHGERP
jgi:hypothetical protein